MQSNVDRKFYMKKKTKWKNEQKRVWNNKTAALKRIGKYKTIREFFILTVDPRNVNSVNVSLSEFSRHYFIDIYI